MSGRVRRVPPVEPSLDVAGVIRRAVAESAGADPTLLDGYLETLAAASGEGRGLRRHEIDRHRATGMAAAERGVPLGIVVDVFLSATSLAWRQLPRPPGVEPDDTATTVLRAANDAIAAVTGGYEAAQRMAIRTEEASRREFVDDLLHGTSDPTRLPELATRHGLQLAGAYVVAVATADVPFTDADERTRQIEASVHTRAGNRTVLVTTKDGHLVCVAPESRSDAVAAFTDRIRRIRHAVNCRVGISRAHAGPAGVAQAYQQARETLTMADRLGLPGSVLHARDLLVYQVLFRDRGAITDLVATVLSPLQQARGGARPLLDTLSAYFDTGNAAAAARHLHLGVRTVTYRLTRIHQLTGYDATDPSERYTLKTAVLGGRLLGWPMAPLAELAQDRPVR
jgi:hypothetical protein